MNRINSTITITDKGNGSYHFELKPIEPIKDNLIGKSIILGVSKELIALGNPKVITKQDNTIVIGNFISLEIIDELEEVYICNLTHFIKQ